MAIKYNQFLKFDVFFKLLYIIAISNLVLNALQFRVDYQDLQLLKNIENAFIYFVISFGLLFLFESNLESLVFISVSGRVMYALLPNLKYSFFLGRSMDQHIQFILSKLITENRFIGYGGEVLLTGRYYLESPLFHTSIASFSLITGIEIESAFKYFPVFLNILYPLYFYVIAKKINSENENYLKTAIFLSGIPLGGSLYIVNGVMYAFVFLLGILNQYITLLQNPKRLNYALFIFLILGSTISHQVETLHFLGILFGVTVVLNLLENFEKIYQLRYLLVGIIGNLGWMFLRESQFNYLSFLFVSGGDNPGIPSTFGLLLNASPSGALTILFDYYGLYFFLSLFTGASLLFVAYRYWKGIQPDTSIKFLVIFFLAVFGLSLFGIVFSIGFGYYNRAFRNYFFVAVLFSGYFMAFMHKKTQNIAYCSIIIITLFLSTLGYYTQVPSASLIFPVSEETPLQLTGNVNSVYQREMIDHAYRSLTGSIACDAVTRNQIIGLTSASYFDAVLWYYPPNLLLFPDRLPEDYDAYLIHLPGISGAFEERADIRNRDIILGEIYIPYHDMVYSNSQSFILLN